MNTTIPKKPESAALERLLHDPDARFMTDGGIETTLVFQHEIDLPDFAAFPLLRDPAGRASLNEYFEPYLTIAAERDLGIVLDTPTWRANPDWAERLGFDGEGLAAINADAVSFMADIAAKAPDVESVLNGTIGPRGDGYVVGEAMTVDEALHYHSLQIQALADAGVEMITAVTMTYVDEAIGIVRAAGAAGVPVVVGFTVETDGRLPSGTTLRQAVHAVDGAATVHGVPEPAWFMINCAHPSHFEETLAQGREADTLWLRRINAIRANASRMSHAELDEAPELDRGDPAELARDYARLASILPELRVVGGCCGTDHEHIGALTATIS